MMSPLVILYSAGVGQGLLLTAAIAMLKVRNGPARWFLAALLAVLTLMLAEELLDLIGHAPEVGLGLAVEFALGPLLYLFVKALNSNGPLGARQLIPHAVAPTLAIILLVWMNSRFEAEGISLDRPDQKLIIGAIVAVKIVLFLGYCMAALALPKRAFAAARPSAVMKQIRRLFYALIAIYVVQAVSFVAFYSGASGAPDSDVVGGVISACSIYAIGYFCFLNRDIFDLEERYASAPISSEEASETCRRARHHLEMTQAYRDPDFDLRTLASSLGIPPARLSQALNVAEQGFSGLVNAYRLEAFSQAMADPRRGKRSQLDLAFEAGFNSKATFYRARKSDTAHRA